MGVPGLRADGFGSDLVAAPFAGLKEADRGMAVAAAAARDSGDERFG